MLGDSKSERDHSGMVGDIERNQHIRYLISRSDAADSASVSSIDAVRVHDLRIVAHRFRNLHKWQL
jgi:hypothetical protein